MFNFIIYLLIIFALDALMIPINANLQESYRKAFLKSRSQLYSFYPPTEKPSLSHRRSYSVGSYQASDSASDSDHSHYDLWSLSSSPKSFYFNQLRLEHFLPHGQSGLVIAAVGPPGRGKSFTFSLIQKVARKMGREAQLHNAGDIRRQWEEFVLTEPRRLLDFYSFFHTPQHEKQEWSVWANSGSRMIPGRLFSTSLGRHLNTYFALVALRRMFSDPSPTIHYFDATNTDIHRRSMLIQLALSSGKSLIFTENICQEPRLLMRNFIAKLQTSSDYKDALHSVCSTQEQTRLRMVLEGVSVLGPWSSYLDESNVSFHCKLRFKESLADLMQRDQGYLERYTPLNHGDPSTIDLIEQWNRNNQETNTEARLGYIQTMVAKCSLSGQAKQQSNMYPNILSHLLLHADVEKAHDTYEKRPQIYSVDDLMEWPPERLFNDPLIQTTLQ